jgi:hypothetical protein
MLTGGEGDVPESTRSGGQMVKNQSITRLHLPPLLF